MVPIKRGTATRLGIRRPPSFARGGPISVRVDADTPPAQLCGGVVRHVDPFTSEVDEAIKRFFGPRFGGSTG